MYKKIDTVSNDMRKKIDTVSKFVWFIFHLIQKLTLYPSSFDSFDFQNFSKKLIRYDSFNWKSYIPKAQIQKLKFLGLAVQIHIEILVEFEFLPRSSRLSIWWIPGL